MRPVVTMLASVASALAALVTAECERLPPEDFASRSGVPAASASPAGAPLAPSSADPADGALPERRIALRVPGADGEGTSDGARCVLPTPGDPPPPVPHGPAAGCPADPEGGPGRLPLVRVSFPDTKGVAVEAELVRSEHDTMRGLMYRKSMPADRGMLFDLGVRDDHKFWMHNTCIPLDLLYIDTDGLVVGIVENAPTLDDTSRGVGCPSRWVLEVNAGWSRKHGVKASPGDYRLMTLWGTAPTTQGPSVVPLLTCTCESCERAPFANLHDRRPLVLDEIAVFSRLRASGFRGTALALIGGGTA